MPNSLLLTALLTATATLAQTEIQVQVVNTAHLPAAELAAALKTVEHAYAPTGITIRWQPCSGACVELPGPRSFVLGIAGAQVELPAKSTLGFAMIATGRGNRAAVSMPRVEAFAESNNIPLPAAIAYSIAHELSHLITRSARHSSGIMQPLWDRASAQKMAQGSLQFAAGDTKKMQKMLTRE